MPKGNHLNLKFKTKVLILMSIGFNFILLPLICYNINIVGETIYKVNSTNKYLKTSGLSGKIFINGTSDWVDFKNAGNCSGEGTYSDPYIIKDLVIDGGNTGSCIHIENSDAYFRIENCTLYNSGESFYDYDAGIRLFNVTNSYLIKNNCSKNYCGIFTYYGINNSIFQNSIVNNQIGIYGYGECIISKNNITNNLYGILGSGEFYGSGEYIISKNNITNNLLGIGAHYYVNISLNNVDYNKECGILLMWGFNNSVSYNSVKYNDGIGIFLDEAVYNTISHNNCSNNKGNGIHLEGAIYPWDDYTQSCMYNVISENIVNNNSCGIMLNITQENHIINNSINNNKNGGLELYFSRETQILNNQINENYYGIKIVESILNDVFQNTINHNYFGIFINSSYGNEITYNIMHYNRKCFTETDDCIGDNIYENNDCIEIQDNSLNWIILFTVITVISFLGLVIIILLLRHKRT